MPNVVTTRANIGSRKVRKAGKVKMTAKDYYVVTTRANIGPGKVRKALETLKLHFKYIKRCHNQANKGLGSLRKKE